MATKPTSDLCVLTIGYEHVLLPAEKGLKVAALLRGAVEVKATYDHHGQDWEIQSELDVGYVTTRPSAVRAKPQRVASPGAIGHEPLKLPHV